MDGSYIVYGSPGSGSVPVDAALTLIGAPYEVIGETVLRDVARNPEVFKVNPLGQAPGSRVRRTGNTVTNGRLRRKTRRGRYCNRDEEVYAELIELERSQELHHGCVYFGRALLLNVMAGVGNDTCPFKAGNRIRQLPKSLCAKPFYESIFTASDKESGLPYFHAFPRRRQFPVTVDIAIPIQPTAEARPLICLDVISDVLLSQPRWHLLRNNTFAKEPLAGLHHQ